MNGVAVAQPALQEPIYVTQDAIDALKHESQFWALASEFMLQQGLWKLTDKKE